MCRLARTLNTFGSLSLTFAPVRTKAIISPLSLHARWSLKPWHQPIVPFPSVAIPLNTLLAYLLRLWHIIVESTNVMPVHLPKAPRLRKNMSWKNMRLSNSTKRLYDTAFEKFSLSAFLRESSHYVSKPLRFLRK